MKTKLPALIITALSLLAPMAPAATVDFFLKLEGIDGESTDDGYRNTIEIHSFTWNCTNSGATAAGGAGGGGGAGKVSFQDLHLSTKVSVASPQLLMACATGKRIPKAILFVRKAGTMQEYMKFTLTDVLISSFSNTYTGLTQVESGVMHGDIVPTDQFSMNFAKIEFEYKPDNGSTVTGSAELTPER